MTQPASTPPGDPIAYYFREALLIGVGATRLYLIRHAQSLSNTGEAREWSDPPLTEVGRLQAQRLADRLARQGLDAILSSPSRRALETARFIADATGLPVEVEEDLREVVMGSPDNDPRQLQGEAAEALARRLAREMRWDAFPGSEGSRAARSRVRGIMDRIARRYEGRRVAVVTHFGFIQTYLSIVLGVRRDFLFYTFNASITSVRVKGRRRVIWRVNDIAHLEGLPPGFGGIS
ncbi:MAG: histidine phosphatase family protein [Dehalococcoidia bacterium]|jgi:probable phosphoglycerate mutase|nr:histidine phosphatase family protein [Dehalococcoidia bacterium]MDW8009693.1 histidine phosphatase family protein [Chloroflexota bacterium]